MMNPMIIVVILFAILLIMLCAAAFSETPRDRGDVFCFFLAMLISSVAVVLVFVTKGF